MHFVTLMVPPLRTDHSLMHNSTRGTFPSHKGLQMRFLENVHFRPFSRVAHDFQHSGQSFCKIPDVDKLLLEVIWRGFHLFLDHSTRFGPFSARLGAFGTENYVPK
jgi:hypothetical protein